MSYEKQPKSCFDAPLGIRRINQLLANQDAQLELLELEHVPHSSVTPGPFAGSIAGHAAQLVQTPGLESQGGAHDTPKVARGEMFVDFEDLFAVGSNGPQPVFQTGVCTTLVRLGTGSYFVPIIGLESFDAQVFPVFDAADSVARLAQQSISAAPPGIYVSTWREREIDPPTNMNLALFLYDMPFHVVVYGFREEPLPTASELAVARRRRTLATKPFNRGPFKRHPRR